MAAFSSTSAAEQISLPSHWVLKKVSDLYEIVGGGTPSTNEPSYWNGDIAWISSADIRGLKEVSPRRYITDQAIKNSATNLVPAGSLIVVTRVGLGKLVLAPYPLCFSQDSHALIPKDDSIDQNYALYYLSQAVQAFRGSSRGTTIEGVTKKQLADTIFVLPPLDEQRRIVAKLESILAQIRIARAALHRIPPTLKALRQSVLAAAFRGELTGRDPSDEPASLLLERIRAERRQRWQESLRARGKDPAQAVYAEPSAPDTTHLPELPEGWVWTTLDLLLDRIEAGHSFKAQGRPAEAGEFGVIKVSAMTWGKFLPEENKALLPDTDPGNTPLVCQGDLLISRANTVELVGAVVLVEQDYPNLLLSDKSLRLVPITKEVSKEFLLYALRTRLVRDVFEGEATGVSESMRNINQDKIKSVPIALPPVSEQTKIVEEVKQAHALSDSMERAIATAVHRLDELEQSALAKAFRGELV